MLSLIISEYWNNIWLFVPVHLYNIEEEAISISTDFTWFQRKSEIRVHRLKTDVWPASGNLGVSRSMAHSCLGFWSSSLSSLPPSAVQIVVFSFYDDRSMFNSSSHSSHEIYSSLTSFSYMYSEGLSDYCKFTNIPGWNPWMNAV
jgi:hypothetical protein